MNHPSGRSWDATRCPPCGPSAGGYHAAGSRYENEEEHYIIGFPGASRRIKEICAAHAVARADQNIITTEALKLSRNLTT